MMFKVNVKMFNSKKKRKRNTIGLRSLLFLIKLLISGTVIIMFIIAIIITPFEWEFNGFVSDSFGT